MERCRGIVGVTYVKEPIVQYLSHHLTYTMYMVLPRRAITVRDVVSFTTEVSNPDAVRDNSMDRVNNFVHTAF